MIVLNFVPIYCVQIAGCVPKGIYSRIVLKGLVMIVDVSESVCIEFELLSVKPTDIII